MINIIKIKIYDRKPASPLTIYTQNKTITRMDTNQENENAFSDSMSIVDSTTGSTIIQPTPTAPEEEFTHHSSSNLYKNGLFEDSIVSTEMKIVKCTICL